jgi:hypothetical protein
MEGREDEGRGGEKFKNIYAWLKEGRRGEER